MSYGSSPETRLEAIQRCKKTMPSRRNRERGQRKKPSDPQIILCSWVMRSRLESSTAMARWITRTGRIARKRRQGCGETIVQINPMLWARSSLRQYHSPLLILFINLRQWSSLHTTSSSSIQSQCIILKC